MDHDIAIQSMARERYLLEEMNEEERSDYEQHFFSCEECKSGLTVASDFFDKARQVVCDRPLLSASEGRPFSRLLRICRSFFKRRRC